VNTHKNKKSESGFSLVEIIIVIAIIAILAGIAWPSYQSSVIKSRRTDGKEALLSGAAKQERMYLQNNRYSADISDIGGNSSVEGFYSMSVSQNAGTTTFVITATAAGAQSADTDCASLTIDHTGRKRSYNSGATETSECW